MRIRRVVTSIAFLCLCVTTAVSAQSTTNYGGTAATTGTTATYGQSAASVPMSSASAATTSSTDGSHPRHRAKHKE